MSLEPLDQPVFSAGDWVVQQRARGRLLTPAPRRVLLLHQARVLERLKRRHPTRPVAGLPAPVHLLKRSPGLAALAGSPGVGAPAAAACIDQLAAWGVQEFFTLGLAGAVQPDLRAGDVVVVDRAWRGDGTSAHYGAAGEWSAAAPAAVAAAAQALAPVPLRVGAAWTTDAPFRELRREVLDQQARGTLAVEMEAAAVLSAAQFHGRPAAVVLVLADSVAGGVWRWEAAESAVAASLDRAAQALLAVLLKAG